jgi:hypothetical protein
MHALVLSLCIYFTSARFLSVKTVTIFGVEVFLQTDVMCSRWIRTLVATAFTLTTLPSTSVASDGFDAAENKQKQTVKQTKQTVKKTKNFTQMIGLEILSKLQHLRNFGGKIYSLFCKLDCFKAAEKNVSYYERIYLKKSVSSVRLIGLATSHSKGRS